jgi:hypothetical protein
MFSKRGLELLKDSVIEKKQIKRHINTLYLYGRLKDGSKYSISVKPIFSKSRGSIFVKNVELKLKNGYKFDEKLFELIEQNRVDVSINSGIENFMEGNLFEDLKENLPDENLEEELLENLEKDLFEDLEKVKAKVLTPLQVKAMSNVLNSIADILKELSTVLLDRS